jgi:hypothetical protein
LSHSTAFSPEAGLKIAGTVVVGAGSVVDVTATLASVASEDDLVPLQAVSNKRTTGSKRFTMVT